MTPDSPTLPTDPNLVTEQQQAQQELVGNLQAQTQGDMASLMARYGTHLALSGVTGTGPNNPASGVAPSFNKGA
jgi:hypothetical protein